MVGEEGRRVVEGDEHEENRGAGGRSGEGGVGEGRERGKKMTVVVEWKTSIGYSP